MMRRFLVEWFRTRARTLPWRGSVRVPYFVVVSEFMLQQTQVDRVVPRFESFVRRFPDFGALAAAAEDDVVQEWSGLGYYRRARLLHRLACAVSARGGELPRTSSELRALPGIGPYTAAAVASLAWGEAAPVIDGNTMRVGARVLALDADPRSAAGRRVLENWILGLMEDAAPGEVNEALMELGATVCRPVDPECRECPLGNGCEAFRSGRQGDFPPPRRRREQESFRWVAACTVAGDGRWLVCRIDDGPILRGLWLPPCADLAAGQGPAARAAQIAGITVDAAAVVGRPVRHNITHRKIDVIPVRFDVAGCIDLEDGWAWVDPLDPGLPTSSLLKKLVEAIG